MSRERSEILSVRMSKKDRLALESVANFNNLTPSEFARNVLSERINIAADDIKNELTNEQLLKFFTSIGNSINDKLIDIKKGSFDHLQKIDHQTNILTEKSVNIEKAIMMLSHNIMLLTKAMVITSPKFKKELREIFKNDKVWEGLDV